MNAILHITMGRLNTSYLASNLVIGKTYNHSEVTVTLLSRRQIRDELYTSDVETKSNTLTVTTNCASSMRGILSGPAISSRSIVRRAVLAWTRLGAFSLTVNCIFLLFGKDGCIVYHAL
ncbi:hypothetical protein B0H17DRAFT_1337051 [Mycena rosella]|uniref:Uncharacterized protein n=1 Tax=Mycena rosella TaxID=1033263 RepID=A0AAD7G5U3_MYCRO|nr:hypothetical protein B0H17DRAFT_1337051 [Mycena rosella]